MIKCPHCGDKTLPSLYVIFSESDVVFSCSSCQKHSSVPRMHNALASIALIIFVILMYIFKSPIALFFGLVTSIAIYLWTFLNFRMNPLRTSNSDFNITNRVPIGLIAFSVALIVAFVGGYKIFAPHIISNVNAKTHVLYPSSGIINFLNSALYSYDTIDMNRWFIPAARHNNVEAIKVFIARGVDINMLDYKGRSALKIALDNDATQAIKLLKENGAKVYPIEKSN